MSQENVETLRKVFAIVNDQGVVAATKVFGDLLAPDFMLEEAEELPDPDAYSGREAFIANIAKLEEAFDELRMDPVEIVDLDDHMVVVISLHGRGRGSAVPVQATFAQLWSLRNGKAISLRDYATKTDALQAVRLSEEAAFPMDERGTVRRNIVGAALVAVMAIVVVGTTPPAAWAPAAGHRCKSVRSGGYHATHVFVDYMPCRSARNKLRRWLRRDHLPRKRSGWYCYRLGDPVRTCGYPGKRNVRMDFTFWL